MESYEALLELIRSRRSIRRFRDQPVDRRVVEQVIEAARWAPSNHNRQGWKFIVFEDPAELRELGDRLREELLHKLETAPRVGAEHARPLIDYATLVGQAPCVVLAMHKATPAVSRSLLSDVPYPSLASGEPLSTAMAVQNLLLAAHALGLGACVMTAPLLATRTLAGLRDLPPGFEPTCFVALGYPAESPPAPPRKSLDQVMEYRPGV